jgi:hypothetical protein
MPTRYIGIPDGKRRVGIPRHGLGIILKWSLKLWMFIDLSIHISNVKL